MHINAECHIKKSDQFIVFHALKHTWRPPSMPTKPIEFFHLFYHLLGEVWSLRWLIAHPSLFNKPCDLRQACVPFRFELRMPFEFQFNYRILSSKQDAEMSFKFECNKLKLKHMKWIDLRHHLFPWHKWCRNSSHVKQGWKKAF